MQAAAAGGEPGVCTVLGGLRREVFGQRCGEEEEVGLWGLTEGSEGLGTFFFFL